MKANIIQCNALAAHPTQDRNVNRTNQNAEDLVVQAHNNFSSRRYSRQGKRLYVSAQ